MAHLSVHLEKVIMDMYTSIRTKKYCKGVTSLFLTTTLSLLLSMVSVDIFYLSHTQSVSALIPNRSITFDPIAKNLRIQATSNINKTIVLTGTDPIPNDIPKFSVVNLPFNGNLSDDKSFNTVVYTPNHGFVGHDRFTYRVTDGRGQVSSTATVFITVNAPPPPPPTAKDLKVQTTSNSNVTIMLNGTDPIKDDRLKFSVVDLPINGMLTKGKTLNSIIYKSDQGFIGNDIFTYRSTDRLGVNSTIATVYVTVNAQAAASTPIPPSSATQLPTINMVTNVSPGIVDQFGIKEIYPTKPGGEQWFMNMNDPNHDNRTDPQTILAKNPDGSWKVTNSAVRLDVFTSSGYHHNLISTLNQQQLAAKGYMQSPNDWKNVEMTGYVKFNQGDSSDGFTWYARGGHHSSDIPCEGTSIKEELDFAGTTRFEKEQWHVHYVFTPHKSATVPIQGKWVGYKATMYNVEQNGITAAKEEIWLDPNNNGNWIKVNEFTDAGGFGDKGQVCGGKADQIITWGGPIATFRWDKTTDVDIKDFSIREIQLPQ